MADQDREYTEEIDPKDVDAVPEFYQSLTDYPVPAIVKNRQNVYDNMIRYEGYVDHVVTVEPATFDMFIGLIPGYTLVTGEHGVIGAEALVYIYTTSIKTDIIIPNATVTGKEYTSGIFNYTFDPQEISLRAHIYSFMQKESR